MQYTSTTSLLLSLLLATQTTLAAPAPAGNYPISKQIRVALSDSTGAHAQQLVSLQEGSRSSATPQGTGPFDFVSVLIGSEIAQQDLRCQVLDSAHNPIIGLRGANTDITFSDAGKGAWKFRAGATVVSEVVCDPSFKQIDSDAGKLRVVLANDGAGFATQTVLDAGARAEAAPIGTKGPYETVELRVGELVEKQDYRCQLLEEGSNAPIAVERKGSKDVTFGDGGKGEWTFQAGEKRVGNIVCDPAFTKADAA
ncbi:MAG: hypothetical protein Q9160_005232 [Pyrenula sp. 1 TL-2023]